MTSLSRSHLTIRKRTTGFSLIEVLLTLVLMSATLVGFMVIMTQTSQLARGTYVESSRSLMLNSLLAEMTPGRPTFSNLFTDSGMNTGTSESGQTLPYRRAVDITNTGATNSLKRTTHFYLYNKSTDATNAARYKTSITQSTRIFRMRLGNSEGFTDLSGNYWYGDGNLYDSTQKIPGPLAVYGTLIDSTPNYGDENNSYDIELHRYSRTANPMEYAMDVDNGLYTVNFYFRENSSSINSTTNTRRFNILLEGKRMNKFPYGPYEATGRTYYTSILSYDVLVSDGTLNIRLEKDPSSTANPTLSAFEVIKRSNG